MNEKYMKVLMNYSRDLESIRKLYQKFKQDPMIPRNLPPVAGKIAWARQLYRKIEGPMKVFKTKPEILKVSNWFNPIAISLADSKDKLTEHVCLDYQTMLLKISFLRCHGQSHAYCFNMYGKIHQNAKGLIYLLPE